MFRTDVTTAAGTLPTPAAPGTPGFFTNGNPALGVPATIVDQDWLNRLQEEIMSLLQSTSITPVKSNYTQVLQSILALGQVFDVSASPNVLIANPSPPITQLVIGTQLTLIPAFTNTTVSTFNLSSLGALAVLRPDGTVVQPGDLPAGRRLPIIYDGSAWRLVNWPTRVRLGGPLTLFCNPQTGNDNNTGLTSGTAFASLQGVWNYLYQNVDVTGQVVTVQCSGNFSVGINAQTVVVGATPQSVVFNFASGATISITGGTAFIAQNPGVGFSISGPVVITATGGGLNQGAGIIALYGAQIYVTGVNFGACAQEHILVYQNGLVNGTTYTISGSTPVHAFSQGGIIIVNNTTITLTGTPAFSSAFVQVEFSGQEYWVSVTFSGSGTGSRFNVQQNGILSTNGGQATLTTAYLPGNSTGVQTTGGQFS